MTTILKIYEKGMVATEPFPLLMSMLTITSSLSFYAVKYSELKTVPIYF